MNRKTLYQLSLETIIALGEHSPEALREARQASIDFIIESLSPNLQEHGGTMDLQSNRNGLGSTDNKNA